MQIISKRLAVILCLALVSIAWGQARTGAPDDATSRIRDEGLNRSQVMQTLSYLTDVIGPRLTGSPNLKRANEWTRDKLASWGLVNAHLEGWQFGRGWSLKRFSAQVVEPQDIPLIACPKAWTPGFEKPISAPVVYLDARNDADLQKYRGKLKGAIVLASAPRPVEPHFDPQARRMTDTDLLFYANSGGRGIPPARPPLERGASTDRGASAQPAARPTSRPVPRPALSGRTLAFLAAEGAALVVEASPQGDGGTIFVAAASLPESGSAGSVRPWSVSAPAMLPQIVVAAEDYNRMVRMVQQGQKLTMDVDLRVQYQDSDLMAYNTIAEIAGSDLKDEIVMLGGHMDSWHAGTGATDDGAGVAVVMEAVRIIKALKLQPRRTIRIGLWSGEEQGLLGSKAYVAQHFGYEGPAMSSLRNVLRLGPPTRRTTGQQIVRLPEYDKFCAYFNLDNGGGKIRGIFTQGNQALWPTFRQWLAPFRDLDAQTVSLAFTGGTDHLSFQAIGLPGFQFIQDPIEYMSRTHHSNEDVYDRISADDMKQASVIMAAFVYDAALADEKLPRSAPTTRPTFGARRGQ